MSLLSFLISNAQQESPKNHRVELGLGFGQSFSIAGLKTQIVFDKKIDYAFYASVGTIFPVFPVGGSVGGKVYFYKYAFIGVQIGTSSYWSSGRQSIYIFDIAEQEFLYGPSLYAGIDKPIGKHFLWNLGLGYAVVANRGWNTAHVDVGISYSLSKLKK